MFKIRSFVNTANLSKQIAMCWNVSAKKYRGQNMCVYEH